MHGMTRDGQRAEVHAPFDGTRFRFKNDTVVLESRVGQRVMRLEPSTGPSETYRITRVIGGRTREDFVGVDADRGGDELVLPVSFLRGPGTLRYKGYSVMVHERENLRAGPVWRKTCIFCHNTVPEVDRLLSALGGPGAPAYQGESVDRWLPRERRARVEVSDPRGFEAALQGEVTRLGGGDLAVGDSVVVEARGAIAAVRAGFDATSLVEMGVGCEACHGGGREHVAEPTRHPSFTPTAPWLDVETPDGGRAQAVNRVCARCHQVLFSRYPFTWEGGRRDAAAGGSHISSGEARDFLLGGGAGALTCTTCHDPHGGSDRGILTSLATPQGNAVCVGCHRELAGREALQAHSHHRPDGLGAACVSCHMPRKNMGLEGRLTPYHRIGTPTEPARVLGDRPLECALCHADRSVRSLVDAMESFWKARYPRPRLEELYGSLDANVLSATLERGKPHEKAVAMATLGANRARDAVPLIARELTSEYPLVREWALDALRSITGACDVDLAADRATIARRAAECAGPSAARPLPASPPSLEPRRRSEPREEEPED
jgi:predicted CXXCH cytochrome family protein